MPGSAAFDTDIPARLDRLPWSRFHRLAIAALGITWILDGLEVTLAGAVSGALRQSPVLQFDETAIGLANSAYLAGAVLGALLFGWLADRLGRKRLFVVTLATYLVATAATGLSWDLSSYVLFRFLTGAGIGGEYAAINSALQELIPARLRGRTDLIVNGSFWIGAAIGAAGSIVLLDPAVLSPELGWRACFLIGAVLGIGVLWLRRFLPESPRWLMTHGRGAEAEQVVRAIEADCASAPATACATLRMQVRGPASLSEVARTLLREHRSRTVLGLALMTAQAFFYNAIFFSYALVLQRFYDVPAENVGWYILPFAAGNVLGPVVLGHWFDTVGRRPMIVMTYAMSGILLAITGLLFHAGLLTAVTQTLAWSVVFFFASAAASAAYLTVGECFPLELRAMAIAIFYAAGTAIGGVAAPLLFGWLVASGSRDNVLGGWLFGAALMVGAAVVAWRIGVEAAGRSLEDVARPLGAMDESPLPQPD